MDLERLIIYSSASGRRRPRAEHVGLLARIGSTGFRVMIHLIHMGSNLVGDDIVGRAIRAGLLRLGGARLEPMAAVHGGTFVSKPANLHLGTHAILNRNCYLDLEEAVTFGDYSGAGHGATFITTVHEIVPGMNLGVGRTAKPIVVGHRAWIGANVTVLPGVTIGDDAIVAAGAVVVRDVPPNCLVAGVPGRVIRQGVRPWLADVGPSDPE